PNLPVAAQVVFEVVPLFPLPDASVTVVPVPSSKPYAATSPVVAAREDGAAASPVPTITTAVAAAQQMRPSGVTLCARSPSRLLRIAPISAALPIGAYHPGTSAAHANQTMAGGEKRGEASSALGRT